MGGGVDPVTARWTQALFDLAERRGALDEVQRDVERLGAEVASPAVAAFLLAETRRKEERLARLGPLLDGFHPLTRNFVRLAFDRRREAVLEGLGRAFHARLLERRGVVEGVVECARALGSVELRALEAQLSRELGRDVQLKSRVNPALMAGVRVFVGSSMIDQSVQGRLEGLRRRMREARLPAAAGSA